MQSKEYKLPNGKKAVFEYDVCGIGKITLECMDELMSMIADRPQEWIPTSVRMPSENGKYLCCWQGKSVETGMFLNGHFRLYGEIKDNLVTAWMPLPKPYTADTPHTDAKIPKNALRSDCTGCRFVGTYDTEFPCANCVRKNKDYYDPE